MKKVHVVESLNIREIIVEDGKKVEFNFFNPLMNREAKPADDAIIPIEHAILSFRGFHRDEYSKLVTDKTKYIVYSDDVLKFLGMPFYEITTEIETLKQLRHESFITIAGLKAKLSEEKLKGEAYETANLFKRFLFMLTGNTNSLHR